MEVSQAAADNVQGVCEFFLEGADFKVVGVADLVEVADLVGVVDLAEVVDLVEVVEVATGTKGE